MSLLFARTSHPKRMKCYIVRSHNDNGCVELLCVVLCCCCVVLFCCCVVLLC
jgi:hypothetical protein